MNAKHKTKKCFKCGKEKPLSDFYKHPQMADGHLNKCIDCAKRDKAEYEEKDPNAVFNTRLAACIKNPSGVNARRVVEWGIKAGKLKRPDHCSGCGCSNKEHRIEAHHCDYTKPLDVIWLCTPCHRQMDMRRRKRETNE